MQARATHRWVQTSPTQTPPPWLCILDLSPSPETLNLDLRFPHACTPSYFIVHASQLCSPGPHFPRPHSSMQWTSGPSLSSDSGLLPPCPPCPHHYPFLPGPVFPSSHSPPAQVSQPLILRTLSPESAPTLQGQLAPPFLDPSAVTSPLDQPYPRPLTPSGTSGQLPESYPRCPSPVWLPLPHWPVP